MGTATPSTNKRANQQTHTQTNERTFTHAAWMVEKWMHHKYRWINDKSRKRVIKKNHKMGKLLASQRFHVFHFGRFFPVRTAKLTDGVCFFPFSRLRFLSLVFISTVEFKQTMKRYYCSHSLSLSVRVRLIRSGLQFHNAKYGICFQKRLLWKYSWIPWREKWGGMSERWCEKSGKNGMHIVY